MGLDVEVLEFGRHAPVDPTVLGERLKEDPPIILRAYSWFIPTLPAQFVTMFCGYEK
ncbi:MAG: hypothetical protein Ct9H300mP13_6850 [Gammaproteobacteria bacterium]|nr:MAG: hypothetical protein Ct9H300mP13_6850 [Gammaproteobacteria bacterium]